MYTSTGTIQVTQRVEFECCYLSEGKYVEPHRYRVEATVESPQHYADHGVVLNFAEFKKYILSVVPDHAFVFNAGASSSQAELEVGYKFVDYKLKTVEVDFPISAETLCNYIATNLQDVFNMKEPGVVLVDLKLRENNDSFVSWTRPNTYS